MERILTVFILFFCFTNGLAADSFKVNDVEFVCRTPGQYDADSRILVLFGGRNWPGEKTLKTYRFDALADKHKLFLLSPTFVDHDYWEPEVWSGRFLKTAVAKVEKKYGLKPRKLLFYGYSAGGQCANLFYAWMPEKVEAWAVHGCGVYFSKDLRNPVPALITGGAEDRQRMEVSCRFLCRYRESGGPLLWKSYLNSGHDLNPEALELARLWFDAILSGEPIQEYGEDDTLRIFPQSKRNSIDPEFRNPLFNEKIRNLWLK